MPVRKIPRIVQINLKAKITELKKIVHEPVHQEDAPWKYDRFMVLAFAAFEKIEEQLELLIGDGSHPSQE